MSFKRHLFYFDLVLVTSRRLDNLTIGIFMANKKQYRDFEPIKGSRVAAGPYRPNGPITQLSP